MIVRPEGLDSLCSRLRNGNVAFVSGGFDPLHAGHVRNLRAAAELADDCVVAVNSDRWLRRKKGYSLLPLEHRLEMVDAVKGVAYAVAFDDGTDSVASLILALRPAVFAKGGDRASARDMREEEIEACLLVGCEVVYGVGGGKLDASSDIARRAHRELSKQCQ